MREKVNWRIEVRVDGRMLATAVIESGMNWTIGREEQADLRLDEGSVSRKHCTCQARKEGLLLTDLGSSNGIWVGDKRHKKIVLEPGQTARIGAAALTFQNAVGDDPDVMMTVVGDSPRPAVVGATTAPALTASELSYARLAKERLALLIEAGKSLSSTATTEEALATILNVLPQILRVGRAVIVLEDESGELEVKAVWPRADISDLSEICSTRIIRDVMAKGEPRLLSDATQGEDLSTSILGANIKAVLCSPLVTRTRTIGAVYADYPGKAGLYTAEDLEFFGAFASLAAVSIENANAQTALRERERIDRDLEIAADIQRALLPAPIATREGFEVAWHYVPSREVSGDFYDCIPLPDGRFALALGDVSGKSIGAAFFMARLVSTLRAILDQEQDPDPGQILSRINDLLVPDGLSSVLSTACFMVVCPKSGRLSIASAGHLPTRVVRDGDPRVTTIKPKGLLLGIQRGSHYPTETIQLEPGTTLFLHTDGITETRGLGGEEYGTDRLDEVLRAHRTWRPTEMIDAVLGHLASWRNDADKHHDDIAVMAVRFG